MKWFHKRFEPISATRAHCPNGLCKKYAPGDARDHEGKCCPCGIGLLYELEKGQWLFDGDKRKPWTWRNWLWFPEKEAHRLIRAIMAKVPPRG